MNYDKLQKDNQNVPPKKVHREELDALPNKSTAITSDLTYLQNQLGNHTLQRLLAQRSADDAADLDDDTASRINQARGRGQSLDTTLQMQMSQAMGHDFSGVRVHTSPEANDLNQQLSAKAFTTGRDIFFREGAYEPHSSGGKELIAHELTHVVQQSTGAVGGSGGKMTVNAPGDRFEQEADSVAKRVAGGETAPVQRQELPDDEAVQQQELPEEEKIQQQAMPEDEELQAGG